MPGMTFPKVLPLAELFVMTPIVSSNVIALIFKLAKIASLSANVGSSEEGIFADRMTHISHKFIFTARKSARDKGDPFKTLIFGKFCNIFHSLRR